MWRWLSSTRKVLKLSKITDLLARLKDTENPIEDFDAFIVEVDKAHEAELSVRDAKVSKTLEDLENTNNALRDLKVHNYDLIKQIPVKTKEDEEKPVVESTGVDSMFESKG